MTRDPRPDIGPDTCQPPVLPDVAGNRAGTKYSTREKLLRVLWGLAVPLFRLTPRPLWGVRRGMLRLFGAQVGAGVHVYPSAVITMPWNITFGAECAVGHAVRLYALGPMRIGRAATVSQYAHLCGGTHDLSDPTRALVKAAIQIGDGAWVCAEAFVGPHVSVGEGAVVGARAVAMKDVPPRAVVVGNPAGVLKYLDAAPRTPS